MFTNAGILLRTIRENNDKTQRQLAEELGDMNSQYVSNWERGLCLPPRKAMKSIKKMTGFSRSEFKTALSLDLSEKYCQRLGV